MVEVRPLKNAPITEALLDFRISGSAHISEDSLNRLREMLKSSYPHEEHAQLFLLQEPFHPLEKTGLHGYWFRSSDGRKVAQFREDGFTFNRLKPYTSWEDVTEETRRLWQLYVELAGPTSVLRVGARYINHITIPEPVLAYDKYFTAPLPVPRVLDATLQSFLTRVLIPRGAPGVLANVTQALVEAQEPSCVTILLDIDAYVAREFGPDDPELWNCLDELRVTKNEIFFGSITEKTARLFE